MYTKQVFVDESGARWSLTAHPSFGQLAHDWAVEYPIGKWAKPRIEGSLLFVDCFGGHDSPRLNSYRNIETWECEVRGVSQEYRMLISSYIGSSIMLADFWDRVGRGVLHPRRGGTSCTTRLVEEVRLLRKI